MCANRASIWVKGISLAILFSASTAPAASAQTAEAAHRSHETTVMSGLTSGIPHFGDATTVSTRDAIRRLPGPVAMQATVRESDSVWNGAVIGAGVGVASGLLLCRLTEPWENCRDDVGPMLRIGAIGAGIGIAIDALIRKRRTIGDAGQGSMRVHAAPLVTRRTRGLQVAISF